MKEEMKEFAKANKPNEALIDLDLSVYDVFKLKNSNNDVYCLKEAYFSQILYNLLVLNNTFNTVADFDFRRNAQTLVIQANKEISLNKLGLSYYAKVLNQKETLLYGIKKMCLDEIGDVVSTIELAFEGLINVLNKFSFKNVVYEDEPNVYKLQLEDFYVGKAVFKLMDKMVFNTTEQNQENNKTLLIDLVNIFYSNILKRIRLALTSQANFNNILNEYNKALETLKNTAKKEIYETTSSIFNVTSFNGQGRIDVTSSLSNLQTRIINYNKANNIFNQNQNHTNYIYFYNQLALLKLYGGFKFENEKVSNEKINGLVVKPENINKEELAKATKQYESNYEKISELLQTPFDFTNKHTKDLLFAYNNELATLQENTIELTLQILKYKEMVANNEKLFDFKAMKKVSQITMEEWAMHYFLLEKAKTANIKQTKKQVQQTSTAKPKSRKK